MIINLKIFANKKTNQGRYFSKEICDTIIKSINETTIFVVNRVGLTEEVDMSRAIGFLKRGSAKYDNHNEIVAEVDFFEKDLALAQPYDSQKYPILKQQKNLNMAKELALLGGLDFFPVGRGECDENMNVIHYELLYIHTQPK